MALFDDKNCSPIEVINVDTDSDIQWDFTSDLLVVGFGAAGVTASIKAKESGLDVLALDRFVGGGASAISGGIYYAGGGTSIQKQANVEDDPDNMFRYLKHEVRGAVKDSTLRDFCQKSSKTLEWLQSYGVPFSPALCPYKTSYPSNLYYLYFSGNESFPPWNKNAYPAQRGHRAHGSGVSGAKFFWPLHNSAMKMGVRLLTCAKAEKLIVDRNGRVLGVEFIYVSGRIASFVCKLVFKLMQLMRYVTVFLTPLFKLFRATLSLMFRKYGVVKRARGVSGVLLSSGGFFFNNDMVMKYAPRYKAGTPLGTIADDGTGIRLGQGAGAHLGYMHRVSAWRFMNPPEAFVKGVMVNQEGERMCNEMLYGAQISEIMTEKCKGKAYVIIDSELWTKALKEISPSRMLWFQAMMVFLYLTLERGKANTIEGLASIYGLPAGKLQETVNEYNKLARAGGKDDPHGKLEGYHHEIKSGPFYILNASFDSFFVPCPSLTTGGLSVNEESGLVLRPDGSEIEGLYAGGRSAVGIASQSYVSGLSIADCVYSGIRAAEHCSRNHGVAQKKAE